MLWKEYFVSLLAAFTVYQVDQLVGGPSALLEERLNFQDETIEKLSARVEASEKRLAEMQKANRVAKKRLFEECRKGELLLLEQKCPHLFFTKQGREEIKRYILSTCKKRIEDV